MAEDGKWLDDLCNMLHKSTRLDVRLTASANLTLLTGSDEGRLFIRQNNNLLEALFATLNDPNALIQKDAMNSLVNLSADEVFNHIVLEKYNILPTLVRCITVARSPFADKASSILSNMTRNEIAARKVFNELEKHLPLLLGIYTKLNYNTCETTKQHLDFIGQIFANLTQCEEGRNFLLDQDQLRIQKLLPFISHSSVARRGAVCIMLKNICFKSDSNSWLLGPSVDILPTILKPLCGHGIANLEEEEMEKLPDDLQYLDEEIQPEEDPDVKTMIVETLLLLCNKKADRIFVRESNTYLVLRELHKMEMAKARESELNRKIQQVIDVLIGDESGIESINEVEVPEEVSAKLKEQDQADLKEIKEYEENPDKIEPETLNTVIMA